MLTNVQKNETNCYKMMIENFSKRDMIAVMFPLTRNNEIDWSPGYISSIKNKNYKNWTGWQMSEISCNWDMKIKAVYWTLNSCTWLISTFSHQLKAPDNGYILRRKLTSTCSHCSYITDRNNCVFQWGFSVVLSSIICP